MKNTTLTALQKGHKAQYGVEISKLALTELEEAGKEVDSAAAKHLAETGEEVSYDSRWF